MRKILFRGKSKENGVWCYGLLMHEIEAMPDKGESMGDIIDYWYIDDLLNGSSEVTPSTVGQYWRTVNNVDLYDGDIFTIEGKYSKIVRYNEKKACFCVANISQLESENVFDIWQIPDEQWWNERDCKIEIIGNIHDNPELLTK